MSELWICEDSNNNKCVGTCPHKYKHKKDMSCDYCQNCRCQEGFHTCIPYTEEQRWICDHWGECDDDCYHKKAHKAHKSCSTSTCGITNNLVNCIPYQEEIYHHDRCIKCSNYGSVFCTSCCFFHPDYNKEEAMKEYESLKPISMFALSKTVTCGTEMRKFVLMFIPKYEWKGEIPLDEIAKHFPHQPAWENHLIGHGFIKIVEPEVFYQIGEKFQKDGDSWTYRLNHSGNGWVCLSSTIDCNCWVEAKKVVNVFRITQKEFWKICGTEKFTKI